MEWYPNLDDPEGIQRRNADIIRTTRAIRNLSLEDIKNEINLSKTRYYVCSSREIREQNPILKSLDYLSKFAKFNNMTLVQYILCITGHWGEEPKVTAKKKVHGKKK